MLIGFNTNIRYKGKIYHVQTEDSGPGKHTLLTLLYHEGAILRSRKTSYADLVERPNFENQVREMMKAQHKEMMKGLIAGKLIEEQSTGEKEPPSHDEDRGIQVQDPSESMKREEPVKQPEKQKVSERDSRSLDDILLEHISRNVKDR
ncbi:MAG TPA: hypothetical protein DCP92_03780 [Nitrospiraceae bacterium]|jgi:hypothetical protein|nr:hypothetical protein [Nitrospiraceae bacterium]